MTDGRRRKPLDDLIGCERLTKRNKSYIDRLEAGDARGRHQVSLHPHLPSGQDLESKVVEVFFEGDERGANLIIDMELPGMEGLYWVDVDVSGRVITRMPLRLIYQRLPN